MEAATCDNEIRSYFDEQLHQLCQDVDNAYKSLKDQLLSADNLNLSHEFKKFYYDLACCLFNAYQSDRFRFNLIKIKAFLEKSLLYQENAEDASNVETNLSRDAKYFLDASCDLYLDDRLDDFDGNLSQLPKIFGNAVVLRPKAMTKLLGYECYFVEDGEWVLSGSQPLTIHIRLDLKDIKFDAKSKRALKQSSSKQTIEKITMQVQNQRGKFSLKSEYYKLKRRCRLIKKDILAAIKKSDSSDQFSKEGSVSSLSQTADAASTQITKSNSSSSNELVPSKQPKPKKNIFSKAKNAVAKSIRTAAKELTQISQELSKKPKSAPEKENFLTKVTNAVSSLVPSKNQSRNESLLSLLERLIETYLQLGKLGNLDEYINLYERLSESEMCENIRDFSAVIAGLVTINSLFELQEKLVDVNQLQNDVKQFIVHSPEPDEDDETGSLDKVELVKWCLKKYIKRPLDSSQLNAIIFVRVDSVWYASLYSTNLTAMILASLEPTSVLAKYLEKEKQIKPMFYATVLELINEKKLFQRSSVDAPRLKSREEKIIDTYAEIQRIYLQLGHLPLSERYTKAVEYCRSTQAALRESFVELFGLNDKQSVEIKQETPITTFDILSTGGGTVSFLKCLNDTISEKDLFGDILPRLDKCTDFQSSFNLVHDVDLITCDRIENLQSCLNQWDAEYQSLRKTCPYQRKYLVLAIGSPEERRYYIRWPLDNQRVHEGFLDQKEARLTNLLDNKHNDEQIKSAVMEFLVNELKVKSLETKNSQDRFIRSIDLNRNDLVEQTILIYHLSRTYQAIELREMIRTSSESFACVAKISKNQYVALVIEKGQHSEVLVHVIDSKPTKSHSKLLKWLEGLDEDYVYELNQVECPLEEPLANNNLLHAYVNAAAAKWSLEKGQWSFLRENWLRQEFSSSKNIERLKKDYVDGQGLFDSAQHIDETVTNENLEKFDELCIKFIECFLLACTDITAFVKNQLERLNHSNSFNSLETYISEFELDQSTLEINWRRKAMIMCLQGIKENKTMRFESVKDRFRNNLEKAGLKALKEKEKLIKMVELFEEELHQSHLDSIFSKTSSLSRVKQLTEQKDLKSFLAGCGNVSEISIQIRTSASQLLEALDLVKINKDQLVKDSYDSIVRFTTRLFEAQKATDWSISEFKKQIRNSYELLELSEINMRVKKDIYERISSPNSHFTDIKICLSNLVGNDQPSKGQLQQAARSLMALVEAQDEKSSVLIDLHIREEFMQALDEYLNSLVEFRTESLAAFENFEAELNDLLISLLETNETEKIKEAKDKLAARPTDFESRLKTYISVLHSFERLEHIDSNFLDSMAALMVFLDRKDHSHFVHFGPKYEYLDAIVKCYYEIGELIPGLVEAYFQCLASRYDVLSNQELFKENGKLQTELFEPIEKGETIQNVLKIFNNSALNLKISRIISLIPAQNEKAIFRINSFLNQTIVDKTKQYVEELLEFRKHAIITFENFEKLLFDHLSQYAQLIDQELRRKLGSLFRKLIDLGEFSDSKRAKLADIYRSVLPLVTTMSNELAEQIKSLLSDVSSRKLTPYLAEIIRNLRNLLDNYVNWFSKPQKWRQGGFDICQISTKSAILSDVIAEVKKQGSDFFTSNNELRIINSNKLFVDVDLDSDEYSGMKIVIITPALELVEGKTDFKIVTQGRDGKNPFKDKASNADGQDKNGNGKDGKDGSDGKPGLSGGHVYVVANRLPKIEVIASGGKGDAGQSGGDGSNGRDGQDGEDGLKPNIDFWYARAFNIWSYRITTVGTDGTNGGSGGNAGSGGFAGDSGDGGYVKLVALDDLPIEYQEPEGEANDSHGQSGKPGEAGLHGRDGRDYVGLSHSLGNFFKRRRINKLASGRVVKRYRIKQVERRAIKDYTLYDMDRNENDMSLQGKYADQNAQKGATAALKHTNRENVTKINAINHHQVYNATSQIFQQLSNPVNKASFQKWQANELNEFLLKMSMLEGGRLEHVEQQPDCSLEVEEMNRLKSSMISKFEQMNNAILFARENGEELSIGNFKLNLQAEIDTLLQGLDQMKQTVKAQREAIDMALLSNGLQRYGMNEVENYTRMTAEKRLSRKETEAQHRAEALSEFSREKLNQKLVKRQNLKLLSNRSAAVNPRLYKFALKPDWIISSVQAFNKRPTSSCLLELGNNFIEKCLETMKVEQDSDIDLIVLREFAQVYFKNLRLCSLDRVQLGSLNEQHSKLNNGIIKMSENQENKGGSIDFLIYLSRSVLKEYQRSYFTVWTKKTLDCASSNGLDSVCQQLKQSLATLSSDDNRLLVDTTLLELPALEGLESQSSINLQNECDLFYQQPSNFVCYLSIFDQFSKLDIFKRQGYFELIRAHNMARLVALERFLFTYNHNLQFMNQNNISQLYDPLESIEAFLATMPRSKLHELMFKFAVDIELTRLRSKNEDHGEKLSKLMEIVARRDLGELKTQFRRGHAGRPSKPVNLNEFSLEELLTTFVSHPSVDLAVAILQRMDENNNIKPDANIESLKSLFYIYANERVQELAENQLQSLRKALESPQALPYRSAYLKLNVNFWLKTLETKRVLSETKILDANLELNQEETSNNYVKEMINKSHAFVYLVKQFEIGCEGNAELKAEQQRLIAAELEKLIRELDYRDIRFDMFKLAAFDENIDTEEKQMAEFVRQLEDSISSLEKINESTLRQMQSRIDSKNNLFNYMKRLKDVISTTITMLDSAKQSQKSLEKIGTLFESPNLNAEFVQTYMVKILGELEWTDKPEEMVRTDFCLLISEFGTKLMPRIRTYLHTSGSKLIDAFYAKFRKTQLNDKLKQNLPMLANCLNFLSFSCEIGANNSLKQFNKIQSLFERDELATEALNDLFTSELFKSLVDDYLREETTINAKLRKCVQDSTDIWILDALLKALFLKKTMPTESVVKKYSESINKLIETKLNSAKSFMFAVKLMNLVHMLNLARIQLSPVSSGSCAMKHLIFENLVCNKAWSNLSEDPNMIDFLLWFFDAISHYERTLSMQNYEIKYLQELERFIEKYPINCESPKKKADYDETLSFFYMQVKANFVAGKLSSLNNEQNKKCIELFALFPEYFEDSDVNFMFDNFQSPAGLQISQITALIVKRMKQFQTAQQDKLKSQTSSWSQEDRDKLEEVVGGLSGCLSNPKLTDHLSYLNSNCFDVISFNRTLEHMVSRFESDRGVLVKPDELFKVFRIMACFEDTSLALGYLARAEQHLWLNKLIAEHICEKYALIYLDKYPSQCEDEESLKVLRIKLNNINEKALFVLNNLFVQEYIKWRKDQKAVVIKAEKLENILDIMQGLVITQHSLNELSAASLDVWETLLSEMEFNQYFNRKLNALNFSTNSESAEKILLYLNRVRVQLGAENKSSLVQFIDEVFAKLKSESELTELVKLIEALNYQYIDFSQACQIVRKLPINQWQRQIEAFKSSFFRSGLDEKERNASELVDLMLQTNQTAGMNGQLFRKIARDVVEIKEDCKRLIATKGDEESMVTKMVKEVLNHRSYQQNPAKYIRSNVNQVVTLLSFAWYAANKPQLPKDTQLVALMLFIHSDKNGLLEQIKTGEGKTLIVALTAAFMALCGHTVDVVSSNSDLAIDGEEKCHLFFKLLSIDSGHICTSDDSAKSQAYGTKLSTPQGNVVYGEVGSFQRDVLEQEFNNKKIFGKRYENRVKCLIVDEVDNMCLDKARNVLYLSHEIDCLKWLESIFVAIWAAVLGVDLNQLVEGSQEEQAARIAEGIKNATTGPNAIQIPVYLHKYVEYKAKRWVESAFQARMMNENDHFIVDVDKTDKEANQKEKKVIVVDKDTGVEQYSTRWSNGLAQFLDLKYRRRIAPESLKAIFMSNKSFFQRYGTNLYGLTGTLGSDQSKTFLSNVYEVKHVEIPTSRTKRFFMLPARVSFDRATWLELICQETIVVSKTRPVLIISENIQANKLIFGEFIRQGVSPGSIVKYGRDGDQVEDRFRKKPATSGDIILATNKGGRGTDIQVDPSVFQHQGMHVILTFLPENVRIEEQAFGRTSRNGAPGTGQFIVHVEKYVYEREYDLSNLSQSAKTAKLRLLGDVIVEREKIGRDNKETARLSELKQKNILHLDLEETLFKDFIEFKKQHAAPLIKKIADSISLSLPEKLKKKQAEFREELAEAFEKSVKDRWAFWLDAAKEQIDQAKLSTDASKVLDTFKRDFIEPLKKDLAASTNYTDLLTKLCVMPEEACKVALVLLKYDKWSQALEAFDLSIKLGDITGFPDQARAFCSTNLTEKHDVTFRKLLRRDLKAAIQKLEKMKQSLMGNFKAADYLSQYATGDLKQKMSSKENFYQDQVRGKIEVIGLQLYHLKKSCGSCLEPNDLVQPSGDEVDPSDIERAKKTYDYLVAQKVLQADKRSRWCDFKKEELEKIITDNLDPSIAGSVLKLIQSKGYYQASDFEALACSNEELWDTLSLPNQESVYTCDIARAERELSDEYLKTWGELKEKINPDDVDLSVFDKAVELKDHLLKENFISQTRRVKIEDFQVRVSCFSGELKAKYLLLKLPDSQTNKKLNIVEFLESLKQYLISSDRSHVLQTYLPFSSKKEEAAKIIMFLKEKNIIKSGGLDLQGKKYGDIKEKLEKIIEKSDFKNDKDFILAKLLSLQGDIRGCDVDENLKASFKKFEELEYLEDYPAELKFFSSVGLDRFIDFKEDKSWWDWRAFAVAMLGLAELIAGAVLIYYGYVNIGGALVAEGINDMIYATMAGLSGTFSWKDWAIQKCISMVISFATAGIGALFSTPATIGTVTLGTVLARVLGQAAFQLTTVCLANFITDKLMTEVAEHLIVKLVDLVDEKILGGLKDRIQAKVEQLYQNSATDQQFENAYSDFKTHLDKALGNNLLLDRNIDRIRTQIANSLGNYFNRYGHYFRLSGNAYLKATYTAMNAVLMANRIYNLIQSAVQLNSVLTTIHKLIVLEEGNDAAAKVKRPLKAELIKRRTDAIHKLIKTRIVARIADFIRQEVHAAVTAFVKFAAKITVAAFQALFDSCLKDNNPMKKNESDKESGKSQVLKDFNGEKGQDQDEKTDEDKANKLQNDIINPKDDTKAEGEESANNRPFNRADIKMLANKDWRNIEVDVDGKKTTISPDGLRKIPAFFRQVARFSYMKNEGSDVGHFFHKGSQPFQQAAGKNDCMLIAYNQSLGREINQDMLDQQRASLTAYINQHQDTYREYQASYERKGLDSWLGGVPRIGANDDMGTILDQSQNAPGFKKLQPGQPNTNLGHPRNHASPTRAKLYAKQESGIKWGFQSEQDQNEAVESIKMTQTVQDKMTELNQEQNPPPAAPGTRIPKPTNRRTVDTPAASMPGKFQNYTVYGYEYNTSMVTEYTGVMSSFRTSFQHHDNQQMNPNSSPHILTCFPVPDPNTVTATRMFYEAP